MSDQCFDRMVQNQNWIQWRGVPKRNGITGGVCRCCGGWGQFPILVKHEPFCGIPAAIEREAFSRTQEQIADGEFRIEGEFRIQER